LAVKPPVLAHRWYQLRHTQAITFRFDNKDRRCEGPFSFSSGGSLSGTGIGLGMQTTFEKIWFLRVEVESIQFNRFNATRGDPADYPTFSSESLHPKSTVGRVMVGYRF
jgi:hypothetical protein